MPPHRNQDIVRRKDPYKFTIVIISPKMAFASIFLKIFQIFSIFLNYQPVFPSFAEQLANLIRNEAVSFPQSSRKLPSYFRCRLGNSMLQYSISGQY